MMRSSGDSSGDIVSPKPLSFPESMIVLGKLLSDSCDIMLGQDISMTDSILLKTFELPCRALGCKHIQCFDFQSYLHVNSGRIPSAYMCPICSQVSNPSKIYVDAVSLCLLKIVPPGASICLLKDGSFQVKSSTTPVREVICIDDDEDDEDDDCVLVPTAGTETVAISASLSGSLFDLAHIVPFTIAGASNSLTNLKELSTASLDDVLHLMNVDTAWGVNAIPDITPLLQKCIRDRRPYVCSTREDLSHALRVIDGVGSVRAGRIVDHFYSILQGKLTGFAHMLKDRTLFKPTALSTATTSLKGVSPAVAAFLQSNASAGGSAKGSLKGSNAGRVRANSVISVTSMSTTDNASAASSLLASAPAQKQLSSHSITKQRTAVGTPVKPSKALKAKGSSGICGEGIADVARPPRMGRSVSVSEVSLDVSRASLAQPTSPSLSSHRSLGSSQSRSQSTALTREARSPPPSSVLRSPRSPPAEVIVVDSDSEDGVEGEEDESVVVVRPGRRGRPHRQRVLEEEGKRADFRETLEQSPVRELYWQEREDPPPTIRGHSAPRPSSQLDDRQEFRSVAEEASRQRSPPPVRTPRSPLAPQPPRNRGPQDLPAVQSPRVDNTRYEHCSYPFRLSTPYPLSLRLQSFGTSSASTVRSPIPGSVSLPTRRPRNGAIWTNCGTSGTHIRFDDDFSGPPVVPAPSVSVASIVSSYPALRPSPTDFRAPRPSQLPKQGQLQEQPPPQQVSSQAVAEVGRAEAGRVETQSGTGRPQAPGSVVVGADNAAAAHTRGNRQENGAGGHQQTDSTAKAASAQASAAQPPRSDSNGTRTAEQMPKPKKRNRFDDTPDPPVSPATTGGAFGALAGGVQLPVPKVWVASRTAAAEQLVRPADGPLSPAGQRKGFDPRSPPRPPTSSTLPERSGQTVTIAASPRSPKRPRHDSSTPCSPPPPRPPPPPRSHSIDQNQRRFEPGEVATSASESVSLPGTAREPKRARDTDRGDTPLSPSGDKRGRYGGVFTNAVHDVATSAVANACVQPEDSSDQVPLPAASNQVPEQGQVPHSSTPLSSAQSAITPQAFLAQSPTSTRRKDRDYSAQSSTSALATKRNLEVGPDGTRAAPDPALLNTRYWDFKPPVPTDPKPQDRSGGQHVAMGMSGNANAQLVTNRSNAGSQNSLDRDSRDPRQFAGRDNVYNRDRCRDTYRDGNRDGDRRRDNTRDRDRHRDGGRSVGRYDSAGRPPPPRSPPSRGSGPPSDSSRGGERRHDFNRRDDHRDYRDFRDRRRSQHGGGSRGDSRGSYGSREADHRPQQPAYQNDRRPPPPPPPLYPRPSGEERSTVEQRRPPAPQSRDRPPQQTSSITQAFVDDFVGK